MESHEDDIILGASGTSLGGAFKKASGSIAFVRVNIPVGELPVAVPQGVAVGVVAVVIRGRLAIRQRRDALIVFWTLAFFAVLRWLTQKTL
jgi:hypothetical protein